MKSKQIILGTILTYMAIAFQMLSMVVTTPFIISRLGDGTYGVYKVVFSVVAYMGVLNFGFGNATVRFLTEIRAKHDVKRENEFLSIIKMLNLAAVGLAVVAGFVLYAVIPHAFAGSLTADEIFIARQMFMVLIVSVVVSILNDIYGAIIVAHEQFVFLRALDLIRWILRIFLVFSVLMIHPSAVALVMVDLAINVLWFCLNIIYCRLKLNTNPKYSIQALRRADKKYYKPVMIYTALIFINLIVTQLIDNTNPIIIGMRLSSFDAAVYGVAITISSGFYSLSLVISGIMFPTVIKMVSGGASKDELTGIMIRMGRVQAFIAMLIISAFFICGRQFVQLWVGRGYEAAWMVSMLIMAGTLFNSLTAAGHLILRAMNKQGFFLSVYIAMFLINACATYMIVPVYGIVGAAFCTFLSYAVITICFIMPYLHKIIGIDMIKFAKNMFLPIVVPLLLAAFLYTFYNILQLDSWAKLVAGVASYLCICGFTVYIFALNKDEKSFAFDVLEKAKNKLLNEK